MLMSESGFLKCSETMKILIACYSFTGNTLKVAESLKAATGAELTRIEPLKDTNYLMKCLNALFKRRAPIKPCTTDLKDYDAIVMCSPVWAGGAPAGVNQYIDELKNCEGKKFGIIVTYGSTGQNRVSAHIMEALQKKKMSFIDALWLTQDDVQAGSYPEKVRELAAEFK
jgi:flavodoxin